MQSCRTCIYMEPVVGTKDEVEDDHPITCEWEPPALPDSWYNTRREVVGMMASDGKTCPCWEHSPYIHKG